MPTTVLPDEHSALIKKLKHACATYDTAARKYLGAVKDLDISLETLAIALRELSQGEENVSVRARADSFCTAVDRHMANTSINASDGNRVQPAPDAALAGSAGYPFANYMSDFTHEVSCAVEELKEVVKVAEKAKSKQDELMSRYTKKRGEVDSLEMKLAKKNKGITSNEKFAAKVADRDAMKAQVVAGDEELSNIYQALLKKRTQTLLRVTDGMQTYSGKYFTHLSKTMSA
ncbi:hypothetical protein JIQ42_06274 [Leishmania sp. Namibia]|uniref:hypothetical protein n=1 Tax=Leishmania sp. Namibia TaxID=2802991 RepID=UPI001B50BC6F|nr:hypothetical protein JIQ42_06274 [Leishmania sp. Namibia]